MARYLFDKYLENLISKLETSSEPLELEVRLGEVSYSEFQNVFKSLQPKIFLAINVIKFTPLPLMNL